MLASSPQSPKQKTILIIEDSPDVAFLMESILKMANYEVISAANGREGLEVLKELRPDLITVDLKMPVMDGVDFIKKCREQWPLAIPVPIIIISAADDTRSRASEIGVADFLAKPFDISEFMALVERTLQTPQP